MSGAIEAAAFRLLEARKEQRATKEALRVYREKHGSCTNRDEHEADCFRPRIRPIPLAQWCGVCRESQPLWQARQRASVEAGVALRALMLACQRQARKPL